MCCIALYRAKLTFLPYRNILQTSMPRIEFQMTHAPEKNGIVEYHLHSGNKHLLLSINRLSHFAETELENTNGEQEAGATTALYEKAKELLINEARNIGPIRYQVSTGYASMKAWTQMAGDAIFHWERAYNSIDDPQKLIAETTING